LPVQLSPNERKEVGGVLGIAWIASGRDVPVTALQAALADRGTSIAALLEAQRPLRDRKAERTEALTRAEAEHAEALTTIRSAGIDVEIASQVLARRGVPRAGSGRLQPFVKSVTRTWNALPRPTSERRIALSVLAGQLFQDTHALDRSTALGRAVARLALLTTNHDAPDFGSIAHADTWRSAWDTVGVDIDTVSSTVLVLNLPITGDAPAVLLTQAAGPEPVWLTLRSLDGRWRPSDVLTHVWVCENPSVLEAAADQLGPACPPLVCTFGRPSAAGIHLLRGLGKHGVHAHVRADDDRTGQSIVAQLLSEIPNARPWRFTPRPTDEATLTPVFEEQLLADLLIDLAAAGQPRPFQ
jgi:uncharacterized protein (TIGR02679 family)